MIELWHCPITAVLAVYIIEFAKAFDSVPVHAAGYVLSSYTVCIDWMYSPAENADVSQ